MSGPPPSRPCSPARKQTAGRFLPSLVPMRKAWHQRFSQVRRGSGMRSKPGWFFLLRNLKSIQVLVPKRR